MSYSLYLFLVGHLSCPSADSTTRLEEVIGNQMYFNSSCLEPVDGLEVGRLWTECNRERSVLFCKAILYSESVVSLIDEILHLHSLLSECDQYTDAAIGMVAYLDR